MKEKMEEINLTHFDYRPWQPCQSWALGWRFILLSLLREIAECFARLSHGLGVCPSVCLSHS